LFFGLLYFKNIIRCWFVLIFHTPERILALASEAKICDGLFFRKQSSISFDVNRLQFKSIASLFVFSSEESLENAQLEKGDPDWAIAPLNNPFGIEYKKGLAVICY